MKKATPSITEKTNQQPETVVYYDKVSKKNVTVDLSVGMGATYNCVNDCYPHTIWGWHVSKAGVLTVYSTNDAYAWVADGDNSQKGSYHYTQYEPTERSTASATKMGSKNCRLSLTGRHFYQNPSI